MKKVSAIKIDNIKDSFESRVSVVKIDVQGAELKVLKGAIQVIEKDRPTIIFEHEDRYHKNLTK